MGAKLPITRIVNVDVILSPIPAQAQDLSTLLILGSADVIDVVERIRDYSTIEEVAADFGTSGAEYAAALLWFSQAPQPDHLKIGRWASSDTSGKLLCAPLSVANSLVSAWSAIANGGFNVDVNGVAQPVGPCNFSLVTNLNGVAAIIQAATPGVTVVYNAVYNRFEFTSNSTGITSKVGFLSTGGGTDISAMLGGAVGGGGYVADGIAAESAVDCVQIMDALQGQEWYATTIPEDTNPDDHVAVAGYIEAATNKHLYGVSTQEAGVISSVSTTDIAYVLAQLNLRRTLIQYSSVNPYSIASLLGRALTVDWNGNDTAITLMFKQEPTISGESLTSTQVDALEGKNCNVFVDYDNDTTIIEPGKMCSGDFIDEITGTDWLAVTVMTTVYNLLYTSPTKIPQTDPGTHLIVTAIEQVCDQGVVNGLMAPGVWNSNGFGTLKSGDFLAKGYYVYAPPVATQNASDRAARRSVPIQVAVKLAGAIHDVNITINVNR